MHVSSSTPTRSNRRKREDHIIPTENCIWMKKPFCTHPPRNSSLNKIIIKKKYWRVLILVVPVFPSPKGKHPFPAYARRHYWAGSVKAILTQPVSLPLLFPTSRLWAFKVTNPVGNSRAVFWWPIFHLSHLSYAFLLFNLHWFCYIACFHVSHCKSALGQGYH